VQRKNKEFDGGEEEHVDDEGSWSFCCCPSSGDYGQNATKDSQEDGGPGASSNFLQTQIVVVALSMVTGFLPFAIDWTSTRPVAAAACDDDRNFGSECASMF
jgi:hypothetical protein